MEDFEIVLLRKFITNTCATEELAAVEQLLKNGVTKEIWIRLMNEAETGDPATFVSPSHRDTLYASIEQKISTLPVIKQVFLNRRAWLSDIAAALLLLFIIATLALPLRNREQPSILLTTLNEGEHIQTTDGSQIWISNHSSIRYPENFGPEERNIELEGEAFFNVALEPERPFVITTQNVLVRVLGTSFNVKSYKEDEEIVITLATGKVQVESNGRLHILTPGDQFHYNKKSGGFATTRANPEEAYAWRDGWLVFNSVSLADITKTLERWYGVKVILKDEALKKIKVTLKRKDESLKNVLDIISFTAGVEYEVENKVVTLNAKNDAK